MVDADTDARPSRSRRPPWSLPVASALCLPGAALGALTYLGGPDAGLGPPLQALVLGIAIVGAAFLLSWAAEALQVDLNAGLALALLALLAVLPEYAVDFVFTLRCGAEYAGGSGAPPDVCSLALANMTGSNRVLVGLGWPLVVLVATLAVWRAGVGRATRARRSPTAPTGDGSTSRARCRSRSSSSGPRPSTRSRCRCKGSLTLVDSAVFLAIFVGYAWRLTRIPPEDPDLVGTSAWVGRAAPARRRAGSRRCSSSPRS